MANEVKQSQSLAIASQALRSIRNDIVYLILYDYLYQNTFFCTQPYICTIAATVCPSLSYIIFFLFWHISIALIANLKYVFGRC